MTQARPLAEWLSYIENRHPAGMHLGLERIREVLARLQLERPAPTVVTVGGTNGKGSTIAFLEAIYRAAGYRAGAYTSPHLRRFNERVRVDGAEVDDEALCDAFAAVETARGDLELTYFEFATAAAFLVFARAGIDVALLEIGLGGRLDAVNAVDADAAAVVSVGLDHTEWLGPTREDIGWEKAHIFRCGRPAICADAEPPARLLEHARAVGADLRLIGRDFQCTPAPDGRWRWSSGGRHFDELPPPALPGAFQLQNASAALALVDALSARLPVPPEAIRRGLTEASLPGRVQVLAGPVTWIFDVAHNVNAAEVLADVLRGSGPAGIAWGRPVPGDGGEGSTAAGAPAAPMPPSGGDTPTPSAGGRTLAVFGIMNDKDVAGVLERIGSLVDVWLLASLPPPRGLSAQALAPLVSAAGGGDIRQFDSVEAACAGARTLATPGDRILVFGSFLTVGPGLAAAAAG